MLGQYSENYITGEWFEERDPNCTPRVYIAVKLTFQIIIKKSRALLSDSILMF